MSFWSWTRSLFSCAGSKNSKEESNDNKNTVPQNPQEESNDNQNVISQISLIAQAGSKEVIPRTNTEDALRQSSMEILNNQENTELGNPLYNLANPLANPVDINPENPESIVIM